MTIAARGCLLLPNHISCVDALVLLLVCPRPIRYIIDERFIGIGISILFCVWPVASQSHLAGQEKRFAKRREESGPVRLFVFFLRANSAAPGTLLRLQRGYELIARQANMPVVPVWLDRLWGSIFSFQGGRFFRKWPRQFPYRVVVAFGKPLTPEEADMATVREELLKLGERCYSNRPVLRGNLASECIGLEATSL